MRWDETDFSAFAVNGQMFYPFALSVIFYTQITELRASDGMKEKHSQNCPGALAL